MTPASLGAAARVETAEQRLEFSEQPLPGRMHLAPSGGEAGARGVEHDALGVDRLLQPPLERDSRTGRASAAASGACLGHAAEIGVHLAGGDEHAMERGQLAPLEHASLDPEASRARG